MGKTKIEWTRNTDGSLGSTWNPVRGCSRVSPGCVNCYAERHAARFCNPEGTSEATGEGLPAGPFWLFAKRTADGPRWTGKVELVEHMLDIPLRTRKPTTWFVNSMSDLFHESLPDEAIDRVFAVMALCPRHTFQVLTKRPERMRAWFNRARDVMGAPDTRQFDVAGCMVSAAAQRLLATGEFDSDTEQYPIPEKWLDQSPWLDLSGPMLRWPLPNVWLGVSVEDQQRADERIPELLQTPAAVRFLSVEPLLGRVDLMRLYGKIEMQGSVDVVVDALTGHYAAAWKGRDTRVDFRDPRCPVIDWAIVGGESGPGARPCDLTWLRSLVQQCAEAGVACFVKQLGARPQDSAAMIDIETCGHEPWLVPSDVLGIRDKKGGDMSEWPEDLRVRQMPEVPQ